MKIEAQERSCDIKCTLSFPTRFYVVKF